MKLFLTLSIFLFGCKDKPIRFAHLERRDIVDAVIEYADGSEREADFNEVFRSTATWVNRKGGFIICPERSSR